jgi:hypothetical protein
VSPSAPGFLTLHQVGLSVPRASAINYLAGDVRANNAVARLGEGGSLAVYCGQPSGTVNFILDVTGYFQ